jgi:hypothetical protein
MGKARGSQTSWQALDHVTADVIAEDGTEKYKNILVKGQPPRVDIEKTGSWPRVNSPVCNWTCFLPTATRIFTVIKPRQL